MTFVIYVNFVKRNILAKQQLGLGILKTINYCREGRLGNMKY